MLERCRICGDNHVWKEECHVTMTQTAAAVIDPLNSCFPSCVFNFLVDQIESANVCAARLYHDRFCQFEIEKLPKFVESLSTNVVEPCCRAENFNLTVYKFSPRNSFYSLMMLNFRGEIIKWQMSQYWHCLAGLTSSGMVFNEIAGFCLPLTEASSPFSLTAANPG